MIAVKARTSILEVSILGKNETPITAEVLRPEALEDRAEALPLEEPVEDTEILWLVEDGAVPEGDPRRARPGDVPVRDDLPKKHPLRGKRVLRSVPAGWGDATIDARGRVVPVHPATGLPLEPVLPGEPAEPGDAGEVIR